MTVIVSKPAINLREELASLRNQGGYQEQQFYFDSLVTNGTFDSDTSGWTAGNSALLSHSTDKLIVTNNGVSYGYAYQLITGLIEGKSYQITWETPSSDVDAQISVGGVGAGGLVNATTSTEETFIADGSSTYVNLWAYSANTTATADFDNVSVFEVDANDDVVHRMPKGWVPLHVYEDGLLQREGASHDYEVVYDGFDYYVKPTVAPSASTETCVIGVRV